MNVLTLPTKPDVVRFLLEKEERAMICLDATVQGVDLPRRFNTTQDLRLILNINMPQPIHIRLNAIESQLRFGGIPHDCFIPFQCIWGIYNPDTGHGYFWRDSMPLKVVAEFTPLLNHQGTEEFRAFLAAAGLTSTRLPPQETIYQNGDCFHLEPGISEPSLFSVTGPISMREVESTRPSDGKPQFRVIEGNASAPPPSSSHAKPYLKLVK